MSSYRDPCNAEITHGVRSTQLSKLWGSQRVEAPSDAKLKTSPFGFADLDEDRRSVLL